MYTYKYKGRQQQLFALRKVTQGGGGISSWVQRYTYIYMCIYTYIVDKHHRQVGKRRQQQLLALDTEIQGGGRLGVRV